MSAEVPMDPRTLDTDKNTKIEACPIRICPHGNKYDHTAVKHTFETHTDLSNQTDTCTWHLTHIKKQIL